MVVGEDHIQYRTKFFHGKKKALHSSLYESGGDGPVDELKYILEPSTFSKQDGTFSL